MMGSATQWKQDLIIRLLGGNPSKADLAFDMGSNIEGGYSFAVKHAIDIIKDQYGVDVSVNVKKKDLLKFGRNPAVGSAATGYTIWFTGQDQANETYVAANTNSIDSVSSSSTADTEVIRIEGHTETGGNKTFVVQTATLAGRTRVALSTPLNRITRIAHNDESSTNLVGPVYGYENTALTLGKPTDTTKIHITVPGAANQSQKASTSLSSVDYWIITGFRASLLTKTAAFVDVALQLRLNGGVFKQLEDITADGTGGVLLFQPYLIAPANSDVRLVGISDGTRDVDASIQGYLATVI